MGTSQAPLITQLFAAGRWALMLAWVLVYLGLAWYCSFLDTTWGAVNNNNNNNNNSNSNNNNNKNKNKKQEQEQREQQPQQQQQQQKKQLPLLWLKHFKTRPRWISETQNIPKKIRNANKKMAGFLWDFRFTLPWN